ncbi:MAG: hypothetical protein AAGC54_08055 [Cyanobacteria bacterium P01_F01_bin.4]
MLYCHPLGVSKTIAPPTELLPDFGTLMLQLAWRNPFLLKICNADKVVYGTCRAKGRLWINVVISQCQLEPAVGDHSGATLITIEEPISHAKPPRDRIYELMQQLHNDGLRLVIKPRWRYRTEIANELVVPVCPVAG